MTVSRLQPWPPHRRRRASEPSAPSRSDVDGSTSAVAADGSAAPGISFGLNRVQRQAQARVRRFAADVIRPAAGTSDTAGPPWPVLEEAARVGLYSPDFLADAFGDPTGLLLPVVAEEIAWSDLHTGLTIFGTALAAAGVIASGTPEQITEWLPTCFHGDNGKVNLAAFAAGEPVVDVGLPSLPGLAVHDGARDEWILNGVKGFVTNGGIADVHVVVLPVDPRLGSSGQAMFIVPPGSRGLAAGQRLIDGGPGIVHVVELILDDVRVPGRCLLGGKERLDQRLADARRKLGRGRTVTTVFDAFQPVIGAHAVGIARAAYDYALEYATKGKRYGRPLTDDELIGAQLADMRTRIDAARLLVWRASWMASTGQPFDAGEGTSSRRFAAETAASVTDEAIQIAGDARYTPEYPLDRWQRDAQVFTDLDGGLSRGVQMSVVGSRAS